MTIGILAYYQKATYWAFTGQSGFGGATYAAPVLLDCRWERNNETFIDKFGQESVSRSIIWTLIDLDEDGYLAEGDKTATVSPLDIKDAFEIRRTQSTPDLRGLHVERKAFV